MRVLSLILFLFLAGCITVTQNDDVLPTINLNNDSVMYIDGIIYYSHVDKLRKQQTTIKYLILNSPGGELSDAYALALMVKYNGIITVIPPGGKCYSACTIAFQAGKERYASKTSTLLYHGARLGSSYMNEYFKECPTVTDDCMMYYKNMVLRVKTKTIEMFKKLEENGLSHKVFLKLLEQPINPNWLSVGNLTGYSDIKMTAEESMKYNAVTHIIEYDLQ